MKIFQYERTPAAEHSPVDLEYFEYFNYEEQPFKVPRHLNGLEKTDAVAIVGGGPVGLTFALDLARLGVKSIVFEDDNTLSYGSRAGCLSRRSQEILSRIGVIDGFAAMGLPWTTGVCYYGTDEVLRFEMPYPDTERFAPMVNLPQNYMEKFLLEKARESEHIELRWQQKITSVTRGKGMVTASVSTPSGPYDLSSPWLVACDGARSTVRRSLGLKLEGQSYEGRYLIADIRLDTKRPTGRLAWFNPPSNPGSTVLMHKLTNEIWRFDYQLGTDENEELAKKPETVKARIASHLAMIGERGDWQLSWISVYKANALTLDSYRHGNVMFLGDAAHPIPIFGVRGLNSGLDDAHNLAWKLAAVVVGKCSDSLLDTFSAERRTATDNNLRNAEKSTVFMSPPTPAYELMREAVLTLSGKHGWIAQLINPRQSSASAYPDSCVNSAQNGEQFLGGPLPGQLMPECPVKTRDGNTVHLTSLVSREPVLLQFCEKKAGLDSFRALVSTLDCDVCACTHVAITKNAEFENAQVLFDSGAAHALYGIHEHGTYLIRPDGYIAARWAAPSAADVTAALAQMFPQKDPQ